MDFLEVIPGRNMGKLHILKKVGSLNGEECFLCRDERGRNIQFVESDIITQAGEAPEVVEEEVVEETLPDDGKQDKGESSPEESVLESLMSKPIEELEGQEIVTILIGVYADNPPDDLTVEELRHRLAGAGKPEDPSADEDQGKEEEVPGDASVEMTEGTEEGEPKDTSKGNPEKSKEVKKEDPKTSTFKKVVGKITGKGGK